MKTNFYRGLIRLNAFVFLFLLIMPGCLNEHLPMSLFVNHYISEYEKAYNTHNPDTMMPFFMENADIIMGNEPKLNGDSDINSWWKDYFQNLEPERMGKFTLDSFRRLSSNVILINVNFSSGGINSSGEELPTRLARGTWVIVKIKNRWKISAIRGQPAEGDIR